MVEAPQKLELKSAKKEDYKQQEQQQKDEQADEGRQDRRKNKLKSVRKKNWHVARRDDNQIWIHGIKLGSRPPKG